MQPGSGAADTTSTAEVGAIGRVAAETEPTGSAVATMASVATRRAIRTFIAGLFEPAPGFVKSDVDLPLTLRQVSHIVARLPLAAPAKREGASCPNPNSGGQNRAQGRSSARTFLFPRRSAP